MCDPGPCRCYPTSRASSAEDDRVERVAAEPQVADGRIAPSLEPGPAGLGLTKEGALTARQLGLLPVDPVRDGAGGQQGDVLGAERLLVAVLLAGKRLDGRVAFDLHAGDLRGSLHPGLLDVPRLVDEHLDVPRRDRARAVLLNVRCGTVLY